MPPTSRANPRALVQPGPSHELDRAAQVHERGLQVALDPARPLADEARVLAVGLFERGRRDDADGLAERRRADAEIRVLGHVEGVPAPEPAQRLRAEVVRGAPERDRQFQGLESGQHVVEPERVLEREHAGERVLLGVEVVEGRLHADLLLVGPPEGDQRGLQLLGLRTVLGVVDHQELAAGQEQPHVAGLGLGLGLARRDRDDRHVVGRSRGHRGLARLVVVGFEQEEDLDLLGG